MKKNIIVISGPSGVGKSTVIKELMKRSFVIEQSMSDTTRSPRGNGDFYRFISRKQFFNNLKTVCMSNITVIVITTMALTGKF